MRIAQALDLISCYDSTRNPLTSLGDFLDPELVSSCLAESGTVTLRKRRLPLEMMVWCIVGMALEREEPLHQIVNRLELCCPANGLSLPRAPLFKLANVWAARLSAVFLPKQHNCGITPSRIPTGVA